MDWPHQTQNECKLCPLFVHSVCNLQFHLLGGFGKSISSFQRLQSPLEGGFHSRIVRVLMVFSLMQKHQGNPPHLQFTGYLTAKAETPESFM